MAIRVTMDNLPDLCRRIADRFDPRKIILFGSRAYGTPHEASDFDLLVIMDFSGRGFRKALEVYDSLGYPYPLDLIVKTPDEIRQRYQEFDPLIREALDKGRVLYERNR